MGRKRVLSSARVKEYQKGTLSMEDANLDLALKWVLVLNWCEVSQRCIDVIS